MAQPEPFYREAGSGPGVVCIHSNASTSGQWRGLMDLLSPGFRVLAPDSYGSGKSPEWPSDRVIRLADEAAFAEPVLEKAGSPLALVGHSYGAAVALIAALANPGRVRALALYEPTLFALIEADIPVLYMIGKRSTASAHGVARLLAPALPRAEVLEFDRLGHMGPITHPEPVNEAIARFLAREVA